MVGILSRKDDSINLTVSGVNLMVTFLTEEIYRRKDIDNGAFFSAWDLPLRVLADGVLLTLVFRRCSDLSWRLVKTMDVETLEEMFLRKILITFNAGKAKDKAMKTFEDVISRRLGAEVVIPGDRSLEIARSFVENIGEFEQITTLQDEGVDIEIKRHVPSESLFAITCSRFADGRKSIVNIEKWDEQSLSPSFVEAQLANKAKAMIGVHKDLFGSV